MNNENTNQFTAISIDQQPSSTSNLPKDDKKIQNLQAQINEISDIMETNIKRIVERGTRLDQLEDRSDLMNSRADQFRVNCRQVKRQAWWANQKMNLLYIVLLIGLGVAVYFAFFN